MAWKSNRMLAIQESEIPMLYPEIVDYNSLRLVVPWSIVKQSQEVNSLYYQGSPPKKMVIFAKYIKTLPILVRFYVAAVFQIQFRIEV